MYSRNNSTGFWRYWIGEPLGWLLKSGSQPSAVKKYLETLLPVDARELKLRLILLSSILTLIISLLISGLLIWRGSIINFWWSLALAIVLNSFLLIGYKKPKIFVINYINFIILCVSISLGVGLFIPFVSTITKLSQPNAFAGLILAAWIFGSMAGISRDGLWYFRIFTNAVPGFGLSTLFINATNSILLNITIFFAVYLIVSFQLPVSLLDYLSLKHANQKSIREPQRSIEFLKQASFYKKERNWLWITGIEKILRRAALYDWPNARQELAWLIAERPQYAILAREILVEHIVHDLKERKNLLDIAGVRERLYVLLPDEKVLKNDALEWGIRACCDIGDTAQLYCADFGRQNDLLKLRKIDFITLEALRKLEADKTKSARQLKDLLELWGIVVNREINKVTQQGWQVI